MIQFGDRDDLVQYRGGGFYSLEGEENFIFGGGRITKEKNIYSQKCDIILLKTLLSEDKI